MKITIGTQPNGKPVSFDLDKLLLTRLLIQANSGAGKSWLLRVLIEQLFGHVQVIVIDPEGEFATLREKFDFVLVGKEGADTPADVRSAELLAHKLLEIRASAVCDLYEMRPADRHKWVHLFLDAMVDAPKKLWHPVVVVVDEAQLFCPEKGAGESEASEAMVSLTTRGRKRGYCAVWATQRLANLKKDATSMLLNRLVGGTFEDVDVKRALDLLSVPAEKKERTAFSLQLRTLEPGMFYALGRAIAKERLLFKSGKVQTSHPQPGSSKHAAAPPPTPEKIRDLLPKLADLPQTAEEKARTVAELTREVRELKRQLNVAQKTQPVAAPAKELKQQVIEREVARQTKAQVQVIGDLRTALEQAMKVIVHISATGFEKSGVVDAEKVKKAVEKVAEDIVAITTRAIETRNREFEKLKADASAVVKRLKKILDQDEVTVDIDVAPPTPARATHKAPPPPPRRVQTTAPTNGDSGTGDLTKGERELLIAIAQYPDGVERNTLTVLTGFKRSTRDKYIQRVVGRGFAYVDGSRVIATEDGVASLGSDYEPLPTGEELREHWMKKLPQGERLTLEVLVENYPSAVAREAIDEKTGYSRSTRDKYLQKLVSRRLIEVVGPAEVRAAGQLFG